MTTLQTQYDQAKLDTDNLIAELYPPKRNYIPLLLTIFAAFFLLTAFYIGISRDLCTQGLTISEYASMSLNCSYWLYR